MPRKSSVESILHLSVDVAMGYNQDLDSSTPLSEPVPAMLEGRPGFVMFAIDADSDSNTRKFYLSRFDWSNVLKTILKILKVRIHQLRSRTGTCLQVGHVGRHTEDLDDKLHGLWPFP